MSADTEITRDDLLRLRKRMLDEGPNSVDWYSELTRLADNIEAYVEMDNLSLRTQTADSLQSCRGWGMAWAILAVLLTERAGQ